MTPILMVVGAFVLCLLAANRSLKAGICAVLGVGYAYGILRANVPGTYSYVLFDVATIGLYLPQVWRKMTYEQRIGSRELRVWVGLLIGWPVLLFVLFPTSTPLVEAVGLRANVFLLPFLVLGARLAYDDLEDITTFVAVANLAAVGVGAAEYFFGIATFIPKSEVTDIIYRSHDLLGGGFRIPATFSSAHAFAGTMAVTLPLLIGGWAREQQGGQQWRRVLLATAVIASFLGIFMAAARIHTITAALIALVVTFSGQLSRRQWVHWAVAVGIVAYVVAGNARLQRFTTLGDRAGVSERVGGSVNEDFFKVVSEHPFGRGLAGGGTSLPYFLQTPRGYGVVLENEYSRIALEQGLPGLMIWIGFIAWVLIGGAGPARDVWALSRRLIWVFCATNFVSGLLGIGMLVSVPQTVIMLLSIGWMTTTRRTAARAVRRHPGLVATERLAS